MRIFLPGSGRKGNEMKKTELNEEQRTAVETEGKVLVSASAGSGKTAVMIEKIARLITDKETDVESVLAVTYTEAAAAEMKERLRAKMAEKLREEKDCGNSDGKAERLAEQMEKVSSADICTMHAFYLKMIRQYFYKTDLSADFRVADEKETAGLSARALDLALDEALDGESEVREFVRANTKPNRYDGLKEILAEAGRKLETKADAEAFLDRQQDLYTEEGFGKVCEELLVILREKAEETREDTEIMREEAADLLDGGEGEEKIASFCREREKALREAEDAETLFVFADRLRNFVPEQKGWGSFSRSVKTSAENREKIARRMRAAGNAFNRLKEEACRLGAEEDERTAFLASGGACRAFTLLLKRYLEKYAELRRRAGLLSFSDLERTCLKLLRDPEVSREIGTRYRYVFVDEYQDINELQEEILSEIPCGNVFMVGDAKQAIYGFRGCSSRFFTEKAKRMRETGEGTVLELKKNYRSKEAILNETNHVFERIMTLETAEVDYRRTSVMEPGLLSQRGGLVRPVEFRKETAAGEGGARTGNIYSVMEHSAETAVKTEEADQEAAVIARIIREETEGGKAKYRDIAVLERRKTGRQGRLAAALSAGFGIPAVSEAEVEVTEDPEIRRLLDVLRFLDNGQEDIPLTAALKSPLGGFSDGELAEIRIMADAQKRPGRNSGAYEKSFVRACEKVRSRKERNPLGERLDAFFVKAERYRTLMQVKTAAEILSMLAEETGTELAFLKDDRGERRLSGLRRIIREGDGMDVRSFVRLMDSKGYTVGMSENGGEDAVLVTTMHKAKGRQFPVCILAGMSDPTGGKKENGIYLYDDRYGFALHAYDYRNLRKEETVLRRVAEARGARKDNMDEMRLLYVAMTRAEERMWLVFRPYKPADEKIIRAPYRNAARFEDYFDFFSGEPFLSGMPGTISGVGGEFRPGFCPEGDAAVKETAAEEIGKRYKRMYPFETSVRLPVKTSPTAVLAAASKPAEEQAWEAAAEEERGEPRITPETGTAYHAFLERADFSADPAEEAQRVIREMEKEDLPELPEGEQAEKILRMPIFRAAEAMEKKGYSVLREQPFYAEIPAALLYDEPALSETILVQGVIDLLLAKGDEAVIIDYKYSSHGGEVLLETYRKQLQIYAYAWLKSRTGGGTETIPRVSARLVNIRQGYEVPCGEYIWRDGGMMLVRK